MNEILKLAEKGFSAEEISAHLEMPLELVREAIENKRTRPVTKAIVEEGIEKGFGALERLALETVEELLQQGKSSDRRELAVFVLKQRMGVFKAPQQTSNYNILLQQFGERLSRGKQLAAESVAALEAEVVNG